MKKNSGWKKFGLIVLIFGISLMGCSRKNPSEQPPQDDNKESSFTVAYVPLDDRPVNVDRMIYGAQSMGFSLIMPELDLYHTALDGQPKNSNNTQYGDREGILSWLKEQTVDAYLISWDQMMSGGLANSRSMTNTDMTREYEIVDEIIALVGEKPCMFYDTVMRLASTSGYMGLTLNEYNAFRNYAIQARPVLNNPSVEEIIANYDSDQFSTYGLSETQISQYLKSRARKLKIADYVLEKIKDKSNMYSYYGIDDSSPEVTIQTNEINYLTPRIKYGTIFAGTDELCLMGLGRLSSIHYQHRPLIRTTYFGGTEGTAGDVYDNAAVDVNVSKHIEGLRGVEIDMGIPEVNILVLTKPLVSSLNDTYVNEVIKQIKSNDEKHMLSLVVDCSSYAWHGYLAKKLVAENMLGSLVSYSNWNTVGNTIGIAFSLGLGRLNYLYSNPSDKSLENSYEGYLKSQAFSFVKDMNYKITGNELVSKYLNSNIVDKNGNLVSDASGNYYPYLQYNIDPETQLESILNSASNKVTVNQIVASMNQTSFLYKIEDQKGVYHDGITFSISNFHLTYYRAFEMSFDITLN